MSLDVAGSAKKKYDFVCCLCQCEIHNISKSYRDTRGLSPSSMVLVKLTISAVIPLKHPATTKSLGSFVEEVIWKKKSLPSYSLFTTETRSIKAVDLLQNQKKNTTFVHHSDLFI